MFSKACEYAIRSVIFIADKSVNGERCTLQEISSGIDSPLAFTAKILQKLTKKDIISSKKGPNGGFDVSLKKINNTTLAEIIQIIDGPDVLNHCVLGLEKCSDERPCPVHHKFLPIRNEILQLVHHTYLKEIVSDLSILNAYIRT
jgi:Rrf2 family iron-sulfur cluster assembly transcriptional regulator